jgi:hypothetical protein
VNRDFWRFWVGETISAFGSSFTQFAIPLLVFKLTGHVPRRRRVLGPELGTRDDVQHQHR